MNQSDNLRWTRSGILNFPWGKFETLEKLVMTDSLRNRLVERADLFINGKEAYHALQLPWRYGIYLFGPPGSGKTAASRGLAKRLGWQHFGIPAHEILDSHFLEKAFYDAISQSHRVIVLEDVDIMIRKMEPEVFFMLLDHAMEHTEGTLWIATSRHAENTPKTQLLRPGRFDETIRMELPNTELRATLLMKLIGPQEEGSAEAQWLTEWIELSAGLSFSHLEELRQKMAQMKMDHMNDVDQYLMIKTFIEDQIIGGDRQGGLSDQSERVEERVHQVDPRILSAALDMTDVFKVLIEKVISDSTEQAKTDLTEELS